MKIFVFFSYTSGFKTFFLSQFWHDRLWVFVYHFYIGLFYFFIIHNFLTLFFIFILESRAIVRYYVAKYADRAPSLMGNNLEERAMVDQWLEVEAHNFNDLIFTIVLQLVILPRMGEPGDLALAHSCEQKLEKVLDVYEQRLSKCSYLAGDSFTLADLSHLPGIRYLMNEANMGHLITKRKNVNAWWQDISNRPSWKKLMKLAGY